VHRSQAYANGFRRCARFTIGDSGCGIPEEIAGKIFEPFFTTKPERGNGLGLWVVQGLIAKHDGMIRVRSSVRVGRTGTVVSTLWPLAATATTKTGSSTMEAGSVA
jgi:signal transduction histidine kinase